MVNRIFTFIENQQLTPTEFADKIGVSRASISSIKTGRTQPTLSLVEKIKHHFPDVDINWLIFGEGDAPSKIKTEYTDNLLFNDSGQVEAKDSSIANDYEAIYIAESPNKIEEKTIISDIPTSKENQNKSIKKVILLYDDGSFEEFSK
jgi:DNA-binding XRE family transcriptional regulator